MGFLFFFMPISSINHLGWYYLHTLSRAWVRKHCSQDHYSQENMSLRNYISKDETLEGKISTKRKRIGKKLFRRAYYIREERTGPFLRGLVGTLSSFNLCSICCATRLVNAKVVTMGLTPEGVGNNDVSATNKLFLSHVSPIGLTGPATGETSRRVSYSYIG